jgi:hypothetical protein
MARRGKKYRAALEHFDREERYGPRRAFKLLKDTASVSFDPTVDIAFRLGVDPRQDLDRVKQVIVRGDDEMDRGQHPQPDEQAAGASVDVAAASGDALDNKVLPFSEFFSNDPAAGETWYQELKVHNGGDGTVPTISAVGQFEDDPAVGDKLRLLAIVPGDIRTHIDVLDHTGLMGFTKVQREVVKELLNATPSDADISVEKQSKVHHTDR